MGTSENKKKKKDKQVLRVTNGTPDDLRGTGGAEKLRAKRRVAKSSVYTGDDPVKKAYYAKKGTMKVRTGRGVVPVAKLAVKKGGKAAKKAAGPTHQPAPGTARS